MDWRDKAACLTADPELFFPVGNTGPAVDQIDKASYLVSQASGISMVTSVPLPTMVCQSIVPPNSP